MSVSTQHKLYSKYFNKIQTVRDALSGYETLNSKAKTYFPQLTSEDENDYKANVSRPAYDNYLSKQLQDLTGTLISKKPIYKIPKVLEPFLENMDLGGRTHIDIIQDLTEEIYITGRVAMLVGYFSNTTELFNKTKFNENARPFVKFYQTESITNWREENGKLVKVVIHENVEVETGEYEVKDVEQWTVLYLEDNICKRKIIRKDEKGIDYTVKNSDGFDDITTPTVNGSTIDYIPLFCANTSTLEITPYQPPLYDSAIVNLSRHRLKIDFYRGLFHIGNPTPYGAGIDLHEIDGENKFVLGSSNIRFFARSDARLEYLEFQGQGLTAIQKELEACRNVMADLGAEFLKATVNNAESTETVKIKLRSNLASVNNVADVVSRLMTKIFKEFAKYYGNNEDIDYVIDTDFNVDKLDANMLKVLGSELELGHITDKDYYEKIKEFKLTSYENFEEWSESRQTNQIPLDYTNLDIDTDSKINDNTDSNTMTKFIDKFNLRTKLGI